MFCYVKQWVTSFVHCLISQKHHVGSYYRHLELRFPSLLSRWGGLQIILEIVLTQLPLVQFVTKHFF